MDFVIIAKVIDVLNQNVSNASVNIKSRFWNKENFITKTDKDGIVQFSFLKQQGETLFSIIITHEEFQDETIAVSSDGLWNNRAAYVAISESEINITCIIGKVREAPTIPMDTSLINNTSPINKILLASTKDYDYKDLFNTQFDNFNYLNQSDVVRDISKNEWKQFYCKSTQSSPLAIGRFRWLEYKFQIRKLS